MCEENSFYKDNCFQHIILIIIFYIKCGPLLIHRMMSQLKCSLSMQSFQMYQSKSIEDLKKNSYEPVQEQG